MMMAAGAVGVVAFSAGVLCCWMMMVMVDKAAVQGPVGTVVHDLQCHHDDLAEVLAGRENHWHWYTAPFSLECWSPRLHCASGCHCHAHCLLLLLSSGL
jgi:hypothetical protein